MKTHIVQQGECLSSLAARYGFTSWKQLYNHPANAKLKEKRPNPNILAPGDEVAVPDPAADNKAGVPTTKTHIFQLKIEPVKLRIAVIARSGKPYEGKKFIVNAGGKEIQGTTAKGGMVEAQILPTESTGRLRVWLQEGGDDGPPTIDRQLAIGHIDPIELDSGVRGRLANLGYGCSAAEDDTETDDDLLQAARSFRARHGLPEIDPPADDSSEASTAYTKQLIDADFRQKLLEIYQSEAAS